MPKPREANSPGPGSGAKAYCVPDAETSVTPFTGLPRLSVTCKEERDSVSRKLAVPAPFPAAGLVYPPEHKSVVKCPESGSTAGTIPTPLLAPRHMSKVNGVPNIKGNGLLDSNNPEVEEL